MEMRTKVKEFIAFYSELIDDKEFGLVYKAWIRDFGSAKPLTDLLAKINITPTFTQDEALEVLITLIYDMIETTNINTGRADWVDVDEEYDKITLKHNDGSIFTYKFKPESNIITPKTIVVREIFNYEGAPKSDETIKDFSIGALDDNFYEYDMINRIEL